MHNVLVIGDAMLDIFIEVQCNRISPEAPVPVLTKTMKKQLERPGGAANVAMNLKALGVDVTLCCHIGNDQFGLRLKKQMVNNGIKLLNQIFNEPVDHIPTITKTRFYSGNNQFFRLDQEEDLSSVIRDYSKINLKNFSTMVNKKVVENIKISILDTND